MKYSNQCNSHKDKSKEEDRWLLFKESRYSHIIDNEWPIQRQKAYGPIIDELQEILEEGFEPNLGKLLKRFIFQALKYLFPSRIEKIFYGSIISFYAVCSVFIFLNKLSLIDINDFRNRILVLITAIVVPAIIIFNLCKDLHRLNMRKAKKSERINYTKKIKDGVFFRKKLPLEEDLIPSFNENLIEYKIKNLSLFKEEDLRVVEIFFERQEKIFVQNRQYANKFLAAIGSFIIILIPDNAIRAIILALFWLFFYSFEYFIMKDSVNSRSFVCMQMLKEAQIRKSKRMKLINNKQY